MALGGVAQPGAKLSDRELVHQCVCGDPNGWRCLYDRYVGQVIRFVSALGVAADERDDAVQEVFVAVYRSLPSFRGESQLSTWIYRIAARHVSKLASRRRFRDMLSSMLWRELKDDVDANQAGPESVERSSELEMLDRMLEKLSPKKRTALVLFEIEGLPVEQVAEIVGCPVNTVWSRLHHARAELSKLARKGTWRPVTARAGGPT
ncbi:MAG: sigma-70 family RNA polymerase sigma factor [Deltaproteobacteria bacterium]|nr:sigma-70 family RNA polymerase sigma factor [Deltaproteobacteria bacterium]